MYSEWATVEKPSVCAGKIKAQRRLPCGDVGEQVDGRCDTFVLRRATTGRPYKIEMGSVRKIRVKSAHRDGAQITRKCARFNGLFAMCVVGATIGRPLFILCTDFAPRVGARAVHRAREGIGGCNSKSIVPTKSAADPRSSRRPCGRRRPTRGFAGASKRHATNGYCAI